MPLDGQGPNPLLQNHPLMAFHPPMLYLGYVGFTVPFSFAIAALITGRFGEGWLADTRRATLIAWGFLTVGIILGAWWSYEVLGWGGYWAWDPVENASLLPWLTATAFIHSVIVQERRGMLRVWNLSLVIATFCLTILGTFLTRSGVVDSVHCFTQSTIGPWLLEFPAGRDARRRRAHRLARRPAPRAGADRLAGLAGSRLPRQQPAVRRARVRRPARHRVSAARRGPSQRPPLSVGEPYFDRLGAPLGLMLLFLMAIAPVLPWRATNGELLAARLLPSAVIGTAVMVFTLLFWTRDWSTVVGFGLAAFAFSTIVRESFIAVRGRRRAESVGWVRAAGRTVAGNPRRYGGLVVHLGVVAIAVALAASGSFGTKREVRLVRGQTATVGGYEVQYVGSTRSSTDQKQTFSARVRVMRGDDDLGTYAPAISTFRNANQGIATPSVRTGILEDVYLTLVSTPNQRGRVTIGVSIQSMTVWLWIGGGLMAIGTIVALIPVRRRRVMPVDAAPDPVDDVREPVGGGVAT